MKKYDLGTLLIPENVLRYPPQYVSKGNSLRWCYFIADIFLY